MKKTIEGKVYKLVKNETSTPSCYGCVANYNTELCDNLQNECYGGIFKEVKVKTTEEIQAKIEKLQKKLDEMNAQSANSDDKVILTIGDVVVIRDNWTNELSKYQYCQVDDGVYKFIGEGGNRRSDEELPIGATLTQVKEHFCGYTFVEIVRNSK